MATVRTPTFFSNVIAPAEAGLNASRGVLGSNDPATAEAGAAETTVARDGAIDAFIESAGVARKPQLTHFGLLPNIVESAERLEIHMQKGVSLGMYHVNHGFATHNMRAIQQVMVAIARHHHGDDWKSVSHETFDTQGKYVAAFEDGQNILLEDLSPLTRRYFGGGDVAGLATLAELKKVLADISERQAPVLAEIRAEQAEKWVREVMTPPQAAKDAHKFMISGQEIYVQRSSEGVVAVLPPDKHFIVGRKAKFEIASSKILREAIFHYAMTYYADDLDGFNQQIRISESDQRYLVVFEGRKRFQKRITTIVDMYAKLTTRSAMAVYAEIRALAEERGAKYAGNVTDDLFTAATGARATAPARVTSRLLPWEIAGSEAQRVVSGRSATVAQGYRPKPV